MILANFAVMSDSLKITPLSKNTNSIILSKKTKFLNLYLASVSLLVFLTTLWGIYSNYSPVPFWDMWDGGINFYLHVLDQDHSVWLAQHLEHRILIPKMLFWLDMKFFNGIGVFLLWMQLIIQLGTASVFIAVVSKKIKSDPNKIAIYSFILCLLFSWVQNENFTWTFQSSFLLVYMFSILAFECMGRFSSSNNKNYFVCALLCGCAATFSMANGLLVFPLLCIQALILRASKLSILGIIVSGVFVTSSYFYDYHKIQWQETSSFENILMHPLFVIQFMLTYLGSPFAPVLRNLHFVTAAGFLFMGMTVASFYLIVKKRNLNTVNLTLAVFLLFILGTAFVTAAGRIHFGLGGAVVSRYTTPAFQGWVTLVLIGFLNRAILPNVFFRFVKGTMICAPLLLLPPQLTAFDDHSKTLFDRKMVILGLAHQHYDAEYVEQIYPNKEIMLNLRDQLVDKRLTAFSSDWIKYEYDKIPLDSIQVEPCMGDIEATEVFYSENSSAYRVYGWVWDPKTKTVPEIILLVDEEFNTVGYGLSGKPRVDIASTNSGSPLNTGWIAYVDKQNYKGRLSAYALTDLGLLRIPGNPINIDDVIRVSNVSKWDGESPSEYRLVNNEWKEGAVPPQASISENLKVYGSWVNGDESEGKIELEIQPTKDSVNLIYMTGPDANFQEIRFYSKDELLLDRINLPDTKQEWNKITLRLNTDEIIKVVLVDDGNSWGQWCALMAPQNAALATGLSGN
ncbi:hypothetical protein [Gimesia sp.]|uniref:hypothetical protein n=1 Tax=Gimesia sp. TaxID=2024833 RepID=UPI003A918704